MLFSIMDENVKVNSKPKINEFGNLKKNVNVLYKFFRKKVHCTEFKELHWIEIHLSAIASIHVHV